MRLRNRHLLHWRAPPLAGDNAAFVASETDENDLVFSIPLAGKLADVDQPVFGHIGVTGIAYVGVVGPNDGFRVASVKIQ